MDESHGGAKAAGAPSDAPGERTEWGSMSIAEVLNKLGTMGGGRASGDAEALRSAPIVAGEVAGSLKTAFGSDPMRGLAASESELTGQTLAAGIEAEALRGAKVIQALSQADEVVLQTKALDPEFRRLQADVQDNPENAATARAAVSSAMVSTYTTPMIAAQSELPEQESDLTSSQLLTTPLGGGPTGTAGSSTDNSASRQSANTTDAGDLGPNGPNGGPPPSGTTTSNKNAANRTTPTSTNSPNTTTPTRNAANTTDDPNGLRRGGLGAPVNRTTNTPNPGRPNGTPEGPGKLGARPGGDPHATPGVPGVPGPQGTVVPPGLASPATSTSTGNASTPSGNGTPAGAPRSGTPGVPPAGGGGRHRADDKKHTPAIFMHSEQNGRDIVGDMPLVGPPVLGDWVPRAAPVPEADPVPATTPDRPDADTTVEVPDQVPAPGSGKVAEPRDA